MALLLDGGLELDTQLFELRRQGQPVAMEPQAFDVLVYLVSHRDRVVPKDELMDALWGGRFVTEATVTSRIKQARRAVGDDGQSQRLIRTVHGRGYRFVGDVREGQRPSGTPAEVPAPRGPSGAETPVRYTVSDGLHIAYQVTGGGRAGASVARDIVLISGFVSHLELDWPDPRHAHFLDRLGTMGRLVRFDKRGTGMSDRPPGLPDLETRMHDVLAVMDAVGAERAVLFGYSEGGPMSLLMAAAHPERVSAVVLYGCYAKATWAPDYPWARTQEARRAYTEELVGRWDWEADILRRCPSADSAMQRWWAQRMRAAATPSTVRALMDMNALIDVRSALASVQAPTLVLHRTGDKLFAVDDARYIAERVPGARLQLLAGDDHFCAGNPDQILDAVEDFLGSLPGPQPAEPELALAAVAAPGGDDGRLTAALVAAGGRRRSATYGGHVVLFDGPATAVRAGLTALGTAGGSLGLTVAEVAREGSVTGEAVAWARALADAAPTGSLWVSSTVAVLLGGSGVALEPVDAAPGAVPMGAAPVLRAVAGVSPGVRSGRGHVEADGDAVRDDVVDR